MKIKYQGKQYCVSQCAKDKFQEFVIDPLVMVLTVILIGVLIEIIGLITTGVIVQIHGSYVYDVPVFLYGVASICGSAILFMLGSILVHVFKSINNSLDRWVNTKYEEGYKKECTFLEECREENEK